MEGAVERKMAVRLGEYLATAEQERYAIGGLRVIAGDARMFKTMSDGVAAEEKLVDELAQLNGYRQKIRGTHSVVNTFVAPAIDV